MLFQQPSILPHKPRQIGCVGFIRQGRVLFFDGFFYAKQGEKRAAGRPTAQKNYCVITSPMGYSISYSARYIWITVASAISTVPSWFASAARRLVPFKRSNSAK